MIDVLISRVKAKGNLHMKHFLNVFRPDSDKICSINTEDFHI
jgi:hypothetical protein